MSFLTKTLGFLTVMGSLPAALAVTARPSVVGNAMARLPTMTTYYPTIISGGTTTTTSNLLSDVECVDAYTACMKGSNACGSDFEECTNKVLFHGKMSQCISTLAQCSAAGINRLFGVSNTASLSASTSNSEGEIVDFTYPTDGSDLGQMIISAGISNKYDKGDCVKYYTRCLKKSDVCGADFELCTTPDAFKRQKIYCESTLARCQSDGKQELFGNTTAATIGSDSIVDTMIKEGADLAAVNAVSTCYKVADQCILNACAQNPYKCKKGSSFAVKDSVDAIKSGKAFNWGDDKLTAILPESVTRAQVDEFLQASCQDIIGSNKYCYMAANNGDLPSEKKLADPDIRYDVFYDIYGSRMNLAMETKIDDLINEYDTDAKSKCVDTIKQCAMRSCGGGSGAACYKLVYSFDEKSINNATTREQIKTGCEAIVNTDPNCIYAALNTSGSGAYSYSYIDGSAFDKLFPAYDAKGTDPLGVVASLNAALSSSYNDAAIEQMRKQCQTVATSCVKSMCGTDYVNCYRNRTDIYSSLTDAGDDNFNKSMNKVGGVLDYTIVLGLCLNTVQNAEVCKEHLAIESAKVELANASGDKFGSSWGDASSVRKGWLDAGSATKITEDVPLQDANGNNLCSTQAGEGEEICGTVAEDGTVYDKQLTRTYTSYVQKQAAESLFKDLIYDLEKEAQAKYNAKLTKEQNMCISSNSGGLVGTNDLGGTFLWVKLKNNKVPTNYSVAGLTDSQFTASNDLYGSFCRIKVTLQSDDAKIQEAIRKGADWATRYFAAGDAFTCGSWIPEEALEDISKAVGEDARDEAKANQNKAVLPLVTTFATLAGATGGGFLGDAIGRGDIMGGLTGLQSRNSSFDYESAVTRCQDLADKAYDENGYNINRPEEYNFSIVKTYANSAIMQAKNLNVPNDVINTLNSALSDVEKEHRSWNSNEGAKAGFKAAAEKLDEALEDLSDACELYAGADGDAEAARKKRVTATAVTSAVGALTVGGLTFGITKAVQDENLNKAEQEAIKEWMDNVGSKIKCYIGTQEAGSYGDIVTTSLE